MAQTLPTQDSDVEVRGFCQTTTFAFDARSLFVSVTAYDASNTVPRFARDDSGLVGLKLRGQNSHPNFAKSAKSGWGTRLAFRRLRLSIRRSVFVRACDDVDKKRVRGFVQIILACGRSGDVRSRFLGNEVPRNDNARGLVARLKSCPSRLLPFPRTWPPCDDGVGRTESLRSNPHPNFATSAKLGWGALFFTLASFFTLVPFFCPPVFLCRLSWFPRSGRFFTWLKTGGRS